MYSHKTLNNMEHQDQWVKFQDIEWDDPKFNVFRIDTRDFHVGYSKQKNHKDYSTLKKYSHFFMNEEELKTLIERYYQESGGKGNWRMFKLEDYGDSWNLKYLTIYRTEKGFIVCDSDSRALKDSLLKRPAVKDNHICDD